jgi:ubiquinone/menaquinone biosynthesis C-methylase UbiE
MTTKTSKGYKGMAMEGSIAAWYAKNSQRDIKRFREMAQMMARETPPDSAVLEVAPGPGYLSIELAQMGYYAITGLDISRSFVEIARQNAQQAGVNVTFRHGNASQMPFAGETFDRIVCSAAFKNFSEPVAALNEMHRVLKPGGKAVILDLRADASPREINRHVDGMGLSWIDTLVTKFVFKVTLIPGAYTPASFGRLVSRSSFKACEIRPDDIGMAVWLTKSV